MSQSPTNQEIKQVLLACFHALKSYQYGNASPDLAEKMADAADKMIKRLQE
jgi:hypothetical protein